MRKSPFIVLLVTLVLGLAGCTGSTGLLLGPSIQVTPAIAPVPVGGATAVPSPASGQSGAYGSPDVSATDSQEPRAPVRTPIRLKAPSISPASAQATRAPDSSVAPAASPDATAPAAAEDTPVPTPTPALAVDVPSTPTSEASSIQSELPTPTLPPGTRRLDNTLNVLVVGSDERVEGQVWRSDVIMLLAVDFARREVGVISFPRDMWVTIPTVGENRINTATFFGDANKYPTGGIGLLRDTLAQNFGLRVDHFVKIDFDSFKDVVDALGGIDVVVDCPVTGNFPREPGSRDLVWQELQPGKYHMDGFFALRYARERKTTSDIDRARRQQRLLIAMRNRAREVNIIPRLPALYDALRDTIETDLGLTDLIALARLGVQVDPKQAHGFIIDHRHLDSWTTPEGAMVLLPNYKTIAEGINRLFDQPSILESPNKPANCKVAPTPTP